MINRFTKMSHLSPYAKTISGKETLGMFLKNVTWLRGLLDDIISHQGSQFVSHFWICLLQTFNTLVNMSLACYPQVDDQIEWVN